MRTTLLASVYAVRLSIGSAALLFSPNVSASETSNASEIEKVPVAVRAGLGVVVRPNMGALTEIPWPMSISLDVDVGRFLRLHGRYAAQFGLSPHQVTTGAGAVFTLLGRKAKETGGPEIKIPALVEGGIMFGEVANVGDGFEDYYKWIVIGPSTALEFCWWFKRLGIWTGVTFGYLFKIDVGSDYSDYGSLDDDVGYIDFSWAIGVAF